MRESILLTFGRPTQGFGRKISAELINGRNGSKRKKYSPFNNLKLKYLPNG